jgi:RNA polymerase sigma factor (sigma-70 family)
VGSEPGFQQTFVRACQGSDDDVRRLVNEYGIYIQKVVRRRLDERLRPKFDSLDFVQMVWASFFAQPGALNRFDDSEKLVQYLTAMARNKVVNEERRRLRTNNRYRAGERSLDEREENAPPARESSPSQVAIANERVELLASIQDEVDREILQLRCQGLSFEAIAKKVGLHERSVRRRLENLLSPTPSERPHQQP